MVDRDTKHLLVRCRDLLEALTDNHSILTKLDKAINEPDTKFEVPKEWAYNPDEAYRTEIRHPVEVSIADVWVDEAIRLANDYAHKYSFVNDDSMPRAQAALYAHLDTARELLK